MRFEHRLLSLAEIDFDDQTFCLSFPCRALNLTSSIDLVGIIHPPVVRERPESYQIVCGRGRLEAARKLGHQEVICKVLPAWVDDLTCLSISFEENVTSRGFNLVEKALVVEKFLNYLPDQEVLKNLLPRLGYAPHYQHLEFLRKISFLEEKAKELLVLEILNPLVAVKLLELEEENRKAFLDLIEKLKPSFSRQKQLLELLLDLARKEERQVKELLREPEIIQLLEAERLPAPQKTERLYQHLKKRLYPTFSLYEARYQKTAQRLAKFGLRLKASPSFEKDNWQVEFEIQRLSQLKEKWPEIAKVLEELE